MNTITRSLITATVLGAAASVGRAVDGPD